MHTNELIDAIYAYRDIAIECALESTDEEKVRTLSIEKSDQLRKIMLCILQSDNAINYLENQCRDLREQLKNKEAQETQDELRRIKTADYTKQQHEQNENPKTIINCSLTSEGVLALCKDGTLYFMRVQQQGIWFKLPAITTRGLIMDTKCLLESAQRHGDLAFEQGYLAASLGIPKDDRGTLSQMEKARERLLEFKHLVDIARSLLVDAHAEKRDI